MRSTKQAGFDSLVKCQSFVCDSKPVMWTGRRHWKTSMSAHHPNLSGIKGEWCHIPITFKTVDEFRIHQQCDFILTSAISQSWSKQQFRKQLDCELIALGLCTPISLTQTMTQWMGLMPVYTETGTPGPCCSHKWVQTFPCMCCFL